ncbi:unnamed protein product [marine sediment metagenome]|uniref:Uncharacterized protein n=1 Tax=marine sediment metagenome TaxID=412755 RepID=X1RSH2_9ZZZZ
MNVEIQAYWGAKVYTAPKSPKVSLEETLKQHGSIYICDVIIDKKLVGAVVWDGKELSILKRKSPLQALKEANKRNKEKS